MNEQTHHISQLIQKSLLGALDNQEQQVLEQWLSEAPENRQLYEDLHNPAAAVPELKKLFAYEPEAMLQKILAAVPSVATERIESHRSRRWIAAAVFLLLAGAGAWYFLPRHTQPTVASRTGRAPDVAPGHEGAILTLADGSKVTIDSLHNGLVATQNGARVVLDNGRLSYSQDKPAPGSGLVYNAISTPGGRAFQFRLPDGTSVWLNAMSSIRYPTVFSGAERKVEITGEVFFDVAQDAQHPFLVNIGHETSIRVLGTQFNVNAYDNELASRTTLVDGAVRVFHGDQTPVQLKPGQQARITDNIKIISIDNLDKITAWKNGLFNFDGAHIEEAMRQIERWYDIKVVYEKSIPDIQFFGELSRNQNLSELLDALKMSDVHFRIEKDRRLTVLP